MIIPPQHLNKRLSPELEKRVLVCNPFTGICVSHGGWWVWGRWTFLGLIIVFFLILVLSLRSISKKRVRSGRKAVVGTGWMVPPSYYQSQQQYRDQGPPPAPPYAPSAHTRDDESSISQSHGDDVGYYDNDGNFIGYYDNNGNFVEINPQPGSEPPIARHNPAPGEIDEVGYYDNDGNFIGYYDNHGNFVEINPQFAESGSSVPKPLPAVQHSQQQGYEMNSYYTNDGKGSQPIGGVEPPSQAYINDNGFNRHQQPPSGPPPSYMHKQ